MPNSPFKYVVSSKHLKKELVELKPILAYSRKMNLKVGLLRCFFQLLLIFLVTWRKEK